MNQTLLQSRYRQGDTEYSGSARSARSLRMHAAGVLMACMLALPGAGHASALEQFKSFVSGTKAAKGEFSQHLVRSDAAVKGGAVESKLSSGNFLFARPGKFIWTYQKPYEQVLQADEATPKAKDTTFDHIGIGLRYGLPEAMELSDSYGQTSVLTFTKFERNPVIAADRFKFVMPKGADVLAQ